jgi:hypothetical protein
MSAATFRTSTTTHRNQPTAPRHRDDDRPTQYGPHLTRRAAYIRRALGADLALATAGIDPKDVTQR